MITVNTDSLRNQTILVALNESVVSNGLSVTVEFTSPSRPTITLTKTLTLVSSGFFSFILTVADVSNFVDDTYRYEIKTGELNYKKGRVRIQSGQLVGFDYEIEHLLA